MKRGLCLILIFLATFAFAESNKETEDIDTKFIVSHDTFGEIQFYGFYDDEDICNRFCKIEPQWDFDFTNKIIQNSLKDKQVKPEEIERLYSLMNFDKYKYVGSKFIWNGLNVLWIMKFDNNAIYEIIVPF